MDLVTRKKIDIIKDRFSYSLRRYLFNLPDAKLIHYSFSGRKFQKSIALSIHIEYVSRNVDTITHVC